MQINKGVFVIIMGCLSPADRRSHVQLVSQTESNWSHIFLVSCYDSINEAHKVFITVCVGVSWTKCPVCQHNITVTFISQNNAFLLLRLYIIWLMFTVCVALWAQRGGQSPCVVVTEELLSILMYVFKSRLWIILEKLNLFVQVGYSIFWVLPKYSLPIGFKKMVIYYL